MAKPYSPAAEIDRYNKIVEERGYEFFSPQSVKAHQEKYGNKPVNEIYSDARKKFDDFMAACSDINHRNHAECHDTLMRKYGGSEDDALKDFQNQELEKNGQLFGQYPRRDANYEKKEIDLQKPAKIASMEEHRQFTTL